MKIDRNDWVAKTTKAIDVCLEPLADGGDEAVYIETRVRIVTNRDCADDPYLAVTERGTPVEIRSTWCEELAPGGEAEAAKSPDHRS